MKKIILLSSVVALLSACGGSGNGELIGAQDRKNWNPTDPYGMVYIPQGSFNMGPSDQDVPFANVSQSKTVSVGAFYMDETEITNNEYRQFTTWVRDSILRKYLAKRFPEDYALIIKKGDLEGDFKMDSQDDEVIDWSKKIQWDDESVRGVLEDEMFIPGDERLDGHKEFDTREYVYRYQVLDIQSASAKANREARHGKAGAEGERDREKFLSYIKLKIYPDTLTWNHDYSYSFNDPFTKNYFWHPAFDDYPVVGVNWKQANAFANWRTKMMNTYLRKINNQLYQILDCQQNLSGNMLQEEA
jgi:formylglycine-generating enzyme required for sulfatase activity